MSKKQKGSEIAEAFDKLCSAIDSKGNLEAAKSIKHAVEEWHSMQKLVEKEDVLKRDLVSKWKSLQSATLLSLRSIFYDAESDSSTSSSSAKSSSSDESSSSDSESSSSETDSDSSSDSDSSEGASEKTPKAKTSLGLGKKLRGKTRSSSSSSASDDTDSDSSTRSSRSSVSSGKSKIKPNGKSKATSPESSSSSLSRNKSSDDSSSSSSDSDSSDSDSASANTSSTLESESGSEDDADAPPPTKKRKTEKSENRVNGIRPKAPKSGKTKADEKFIVNGTSQKKADNKNVQFQATSMPLADKNGKSAKQPRKSNAPFQRIKADTVKFVDERLKDNSFYSRGAKVGDYGERAHADLVVTRGDSFRKEKNKKKRGSYRGGEISLQSHSIKFT